MKKFILIAFVGLFGFLSAIAQQSRDVSLNIRLNPIQSLTVNADQLTVNLDYRSKDDYKSGVTVIEQNHLSVFSTGGFEILSKSKSPYLSNNGQNIDISDITLSSGAGTNNQLDQANYKSISLSQSDNVLLSSIKGAANRNINISYSAKGDYKYLDLYRHSGSNNIFNTIVTYTIIPK